MIPTVCQADAERCGVESAALMSSVKDGMAVCPKKIFHFYFDGSNLL